MLEEIKGNLFDTEAPTIMHGCNIQGVMGSGVAAQIRRKYPKAYEEYVRDIQSWKDSGFSPLGRSSQRWCSGKLIVNLYTQEFYGKDGRVYASCDNIQNSIQHFFSSNDLSGQQIAMPQIGCGLGGLHWSQVKPILIDLSDLYDVDFLVYSL